MGDLFSNISVSWLDYFSQLLIQNTLFLALVLLVLYYSNSIPARFRYFFCVIALVKLALPLFIPLRLFASEPVSNLITAYPARFFSAETAISTSLPAGNTAAIPLSFNWTEILFCIWICGILIYLIFWSYTFIGRLYS